MAGLQNLPWTVPPQHLGPSALAFWNTVGNQYVFPAHTPFIIFPDYTLYDCNPPAHLPAAAYLNNSGLAMRIEMRLPSTNAIEHDVMLTGDANFESVYSIYPGFGGRLTAIMAVHHGSNAHGASGNLPAGYCLLKCMNSVSLIEK